MSFGYEHDYGVKLRADADASSSFADYVARRIAGGHALPGHIAEKFSPAPSAQQPPTRNHQPSTLKA